MKVAQSSGPPQRRPEPFTLFVLVADGSMYLRSLRLESIHQSKRSASDRPSAVAFEHLGVPIFKQWASLDLSRFPIFMMMVLHFSIIILFIVY
jgi:hypothetical protein